MKGQSNQGREDGCKYKFGLNFPSHYDVSISGTRLRKENKLSTHSILFSDWRDSRKKEEYFTLVIILDTKFPKKKISTY